MNNNPLFDKNFLKQLDVYSHKEKYVRITSLNINDIPVEQIEGIVTGGNINIKGDSAIRRTCSLSIAAPLDSQITDYYWAFNHKFKVEIGLANQINEMYDSIIWFPQGVFIINNFSKSETASALNISLSGQDKMCRLNGSMGGIIPVEVDFAHEERIDEDGNITIHNVTLHDIIINAVQNYGNEKLSNILINDLDMQGLELWEYHGNIPLYFYYQLGSEHTNSLAGSVLNLVFDTKDNITVQAREEGQTEYAEQKISSLNQYYQMNVLDSTLNLNATNVEYCKSGLGAVDTKIIRIETGMTAGYHQIPLICSGDLIAKGGTNVEAAVLSKIKSQMGDYEYFYDLEGHFVFQKKRTYTNELFSPINGDIVEPMTTLSPYAYKFDNKNMITDISYSPKITDIKNDFTIWGTTSTGASIHARYAIQKKPQYYKSYDGVEYFANQVDWRELIYQMAKDYGHYNQKLDFYKRIQDNNILKDGTILYPDGCTGYEQYYTDIQGFWRYLYNLNPDDEVYLPRQEYYSAFSTIKPGWNKLIHNGPENLVFWFDFLDVGEAPLSQFSVDAIGPRPKYENISGTASICLNQTPEVLFTIEDEIVQEDENITAYSVLNISQEKQPLFNLASPGVSLISKANELIYQHACCTEGVNLTCIPIYYLEPNTRIYVEGIGDLIITDISYNLTYNGMMTLTCTKVIQSIY